MEDTKEKIKWHLYRLYIRSVVDENNIPDTLTFLQDLAQEIEEMIDILENDFIQLPPEDLGE